MKKIIQLLVFVLVLQTTAQSKLTATDWQNDLNFLQETIHNDYAFLFKKTTKSIFDAEVEKLHNEIPNLQEHEIVVGFARIISLFKYGHTSLGFRYEPYAFHNLPINLYHFNDGVYIQGAHKDYQQLLGAKVIAIEGVNVVDALKAIYPVVPAENDQFFKAFGINYLRIPEVLHAQGIIQELSTTVEYTLEKDNKIFKQLFKALPKGERVPVNYSLVAQEGDWMEARDQSSTPHYLKHLDKIYYYEYLPEQKAVYVRHSQIQDDPSENIPEFYNRVFEFIENNDVERLILDVRLNGGGNNYKNKPIVKGIIRSDKINKQGHFFVITGRRTFSACQNLVNELDTYTNAIFVGEPTAENINFYGDNNRVELPNSKIPAFLSFAWWQDKPQWENGPWTVPHLAVDMSYEDYKTNKDPVLEKALTFSDPNFIMDPMQHLTDLFMAGNMVQLKADAQKIVNSPKYKFFDFESKFNNAGFQVMGNGQVEAAIFVFDMNTGLFPNSSEAWYGLAEAYSKLKNFVKAKTYYNKAIVLNPNGKFAKTAQKRLDEMANN